MTKDNSVTLSKKYKSLKRFKGILSFILFLLIMGGIIGIYLLVTQEDFEMACANFELDRLVERSYFIRSSSFFTNECF